MPLAIPDEVKARAIEMSVRGETYGEIQRVTGVSKRTIIRWRSEEPVYRRVALERAETAREINLGAKIAEFLEANIQALIAVSNQLGDREWIAGQSAQDIIDVYNAVADRTVQILASIQPAPPNPAIPSDVGGERSADPAD